MPLSRRLFQLCERVLNGHALRLALVGLEEDRPSVESEGLPPRKGGEVSCTDRFSHSPRLS